MWVCYIYNFFYIISGNCQCSLNDLTISQSSTGSSVDSSPEWKVTITNPCPCSVANVNLQCSGFQPVEKPDPAALAINGDQCLVNKGMPLYPRTSFTFNYAWNDKYNFSIDSGEVMCSWENNRIHLFNYKITKKKINIIRKWVAN